MRQKLGPPLQNKVVQKLKLSKNVNTKIRSSNPLILKELHILENQDDFMTYWNDLEDLNLAIFVTSTSLHLKVFKNLLS